MDNRPTGRQKHVTGAGKGVYKRGEGLNTGGPVGRADGYAGRGSGGGGGGAVRAGGISLGTIALLVIAFFVLKSCLGGSSGGTVQTAGSAGQSGYGGLGSSILGSLLGGDDGGTASTPSSDSGSSLSSLLGGFSGGGSVSAGWDRTANVGTLNTKVASGAREKRTQLRGDGKDFVTIMVYMCGTDLESKSGMATADLQEMAAATLGDQVNLLVYTGGCKAWKNSVVSSSVNQVYKVESGGLRCLVSDDGNDSLVKPATLTRFIKFCKTNYPADRYELILWDHGGGSLSGFGYDEKNTKAGSMTLKGIRDALKDAGTTFDFVGFDACLMATLETGLMLEPYADYMIASEETEPGVGWYYTNWLTKLNQNTSTPTVELGKMIVDDFVSVCNQKCSGQKTTLSVVDLAELAKTVPQPLREFSAATSEMIQNGEFKTVSDARAGTREFAASNKIDQIDLTHLASKLGTKEGEALAQALLGAVKYNKTSSSVTNAYGISIYFPYQKTSRVDSAVSAYQALGMDDEYSRCIRQFASLETGGQAASGGAASPLGSLLGGDSVGGGVDLSGLLGSLFGGRSLGDVAGLSEENSAFLQSGVDEQTAFQTISANSFDPQQLVWTQSGGSTVLRMSEKNWSLVHELQLNVFYDDGEGFIDLGLDNVYDFTDDGCLVGDYDGTWLAIDGQPVAYYYVDSVYHNDRYTITGRVPVLLNGERAELILVFDNAHPYGYIAGARSDYVDGETDTVAKNMTELQAGDTIDYVCDYYGYDGSWQNSYMLGEQTTYREGMEISNVYIDREHAKATYLFTDIYDQEYWTPEMN